MTAGDPDSTRLIGAGAEDDRTVLSKPSAPPQPAPAAPAGRGRGTLSPGQLLGNTYEIEEMLARGGMGEVYRARHLELGSLHAIKVILPELAEDQRIISLFQEEARKLRRLRADAIVAYEGLFRDENGARYLVMEFVDGPSLAQVIRRGALSVEEVRALRDRCASGLAAAHDKGVYHRDISPDNIILVDERMELAKIIDFGIAKSTEPGDRTVVGQDFAGKYSYVSPEQLGMYGGAVDARSDIYSLGLVLVAAARGKHLDMGNSPASVVIARQSPPDLGELPEELRAEIAPMLEPDPANRPPSMRHLPGLVPEGAGPTIVPSARAAVPLPGMADVPLPTLSGATATQPSAPPMELPPPVPPKPGHARWLVPLVAGISAFALIAGGGAWVFYPSLFPSAHETPVASNPAPNPAPSPVPSSTGETTPPPAPAPTPARPTVASVQAALATILSRYDCAGLKGTVGPDLQGSVTGFAKTADLPKLRTALAGLGPGVAISADGVKGMVWPHCAVAQLVGTATSFGADTPALRLNNPSGTYHNGEKLLIDLTVPAAAGGYLSVDFFDSSGLVQHIYPTAGSGAVKAGQHIVLGKGGIYEMSPPFGPNMILALVSPTPIFPAARQPQEDAGAYLAALKRQIAVLGEKGQTVESDYKLFDTVP